MSNIKCIIIEDEPLAVKVLSDYIRQVSFLELLGTFKDALLATDYLRHTTPDLIFLDIHMPKLKGMAFLKTLPNAPAIIITTAYHQYAVEGFNLNVTDYLLKPFDFDRFLVAVNKVDKLNTVNKLNKISQTPTTPEGLPQPTDHREPRDFVFISVQKKKVKIQFADIVYIESQREYIRIKTIRNEYLTKMSTHEIEAILPTHLFRRVHRSFIVSIQMIDSYTAEAVEVNGVSIPIGKGYRDSLDKW